MDPWVVPAIAIVVGLVSGGIGSYAGLKVWQARQEIYNETRDQRQTAMQAEIDMLRLRTHDYAEDLLVHDIEIDSIMEKLSMQRVKRQRLRNRGSIA